MRRHEAPVGDVEQPGDAVPAQSLELGAGNLELGVDRDDDEQEDERGEQPSGAPSPEGQQADVVAPAPLEHQQGGDEEPAEDEEGVDAEESAGEAGFAEVEHHDRRHRQGPQAVEAGLVGELVRGAGVGRRHAEDGTGAARHRRVARRFTLLQRRDRLVRGVAVRSPDDDGTRPVTMWLVRDGQVLAAAESPSSMRGRTRGLLGRDGIDGVMVLEPCRNVHTFGMRFPIDVAFCDRDGVVVRVVTLRAPADLARSCGAPRGCSKPRPARSIAGA